MIVRLALGTALLLATACAPRLGGTHFERWAREDLARQSAQVTAPPVAPPAVTSPAVSAPVEPPPTIPPPARYPDEASSGTTTPDTPPEGRVVRPEEEDEVLY